VGKGTDPFAPEGVTWTPVSPRLATLRRLLLLVSVGVPLIGLAAVLLLGDVDGGGRWLLGITVVAAALVAWAWTAIARSVRAYGYAERGDDLLVRRGVRLRRLVAVPYGRMQFVDVSTGPLQRAFGLASVQLHTAAAATDAMVPGLTAEEAARLRDRLAALGQAQAAGL